MIETNTSAIEPVGLVAQRGFFARSALRRKGEVMDTMKIRSLNSSKMNKACRGARSLFLSTDCFLVDPANNFIVGFVGRNGFNPHVWSGECSPENLTLIAQRLQAPIEQVLRLAKIVRIPFLINAKYFALISVCAHDPVDRGGADIKPVKGFEVDTIGRSFVDATCVLQGSMRDQDFEILFQDEIQTKIDSRVYYWKPAYVFPLNIGSVDAVEGGRL